MSNAFSRAAVGPWLASLVAHGVAVARMRATAGAGLPATAPTRLTVSALGAGEELVDGPEEDGPGGLVGEQDVVAAG